MFQYIVLLQYSKVQCAVLMNSLIIRGAYKLNIIIQQVVKFSISVCLRQINWSNYVQNNEEKKMESDVNFSEY